MPEPPPLLRDYKSNRVGPLAALVYAALWVLGAFAWPTAGHCRVGPLNLWLLGLLGAIVPALVDLAVTRRRRADWLTPLTVAAWSFVIAGAAVLVAALVRYILTAGSCN